MSKAHVPPQAAGNTGRVVRYRPGLTEGTLGPQGALKKGGLWFRTLCERCNNRAGERADRAYADFANRVSFALNTASVWVPSGVPPVNVAPGLVSRSVLIGMMAVNPRLRINHPSLAEQLLNDAPEVALPGGLQLRLALTQSSFARAAAASWWLRALGQRRYYFAVAEVWFKPFAWALVPDGDDVSLGQNFIEQGPWADCTDWSRYSTDRVSVDLRNVVRALSVVRHPRDSADHDSWMEMLSNEAPLLEGRIVVR